MIRTLTILVEDHEMKKDNKKVEAWAREKKYLGRYVNVTIHTQLY